MVMANGNGNGIGNGHGIDNNNNSILMGDTSIEITPSTMDDAITTSSFTPSSPTTMNTSSTSTSTSTSSSSSLLPIPQLAKIMTSITLLLI